jgi:phage tail-like protein
MADAADKKYPLVTFQFFLELDGVSWAQFRECSGLSSEHEVIENKAVSKDGHDFVGKMPGRLKWGDISLKRGMTSEMDIWKWRKQVEDGKIAAARKNGSIVLYDYDFKEVARWNFKNAWPSKAAGPSLNAGSSEAAVEELTLVHEGIERVK